MSKLLLKNAYQTPIQKQGNIKHYCKRMVNIHVSKTGKFIDSLDCIQML